jgi:hypothetical protein
MGSMETTLEWREARYEALDVRVTLILVGLGGVLLFGWMLVRLLLRLRGRGPKLQVDGPKGRILVQLTAGLVCVNAFLLGIGVLGGSYAAYEDRALASLCVVLAVLWLWGWIEYEFAKPGLLVIPEARHIAGARSRPRLRR